MRAVVATGVGGPEVLEIVELPAPEPGPGEVLVEVVAAGVNRADILQRCGYYPPPPGASPLLGLECSGTVAALGPGCARFAVGDQVAALLTGGGYAELVVVPEAHLLPVPAAVGVRDSAALPEVACTVWSMVFDQARLRAGETLLVHGGASGVGTMAIQLGVAAGARVLVTVGSAAKALACRSLGADAAVNYREGDFAAAVLDLTDGRGADVILDIIGAKYLGRNIGCLAEDGRIAVIGLQGGTRGELNLAALLARRGTIHAAGLRARPDAQKGAVVAGTRAQVWPLVEAGTVRPVIHTVLPLEQVRQAHELIERGEQVGKVLIELRA